MLLYTFRGIANKDLTCEVATKIAIIEGQHLKKHENAQKILIAGDHRVSTSMLKSALTTGFLSVGLNVIDCGMLPTPVLSFIVKKLSLPGVMVTASHNPPEWNGFQFLEPDSHIYGPDAAGEGTRLRPITHYVPKPMLPFFGKPFLAYTLENLVGLVDSVVLVVNYKKEQIIDYFGNSYSSLPLEYVEQQHLKGTAAALSTVRHSVEGRFLVIQGDVYASRCLLQGMKETNGEHLLSLVKVVDPENHAGIEHHNAVVKKTFAESPWVDKGIWLFSPIIFDYIEKIELRGGELRGLVAVQDMINDGICVQTYISHEPWIELGDHAPLESVLNALKFFRDFHNPKVNHIPNHERPLRLSTSFRDSSIECSSVSVETIGCEISNSLVFGEGTLIDSKIQNSVVYCGRTVSKVKVINAIRAVNGLGL